MTAVAATPPSAAGQSGWKTAHAVYAIAPASAVQIVRRWKVEMDTRHRR